MSSSQPPPPHTPRKTIGISTKMYFTLSQTTSYITSLTPLTTLAQTHNIHLFILPTFLSLPTLRTSITLGAQNCAPADAGAFTGEVSPRDLKELGCELVELGHAERFRLCGETEEMVVKKAEAVVRNSMIPLVCVGELHKNTVESAVAECKGLVEKVLAATGEAEVIFAYEPVWAIGQAEPAGKEHIVGVVREIRRMCAGRKVRILYGGSAGPGTWEGVKEGVDGLFLGRFGHDIENVRKILEEVGEN